MAEKELDTLNLIREKVVIYIRKHLTDKKIASNLEIALYNDCIKRTSLTEIRIHKYKIFKQRYNYGLSFIILNIKEIEDKINKNEISPDNIFNKDPLELFPEKWKESKIRKTEEEKFLYENQLVSNSKTVKCYECNEKNVYVSYKQTRSADEPETIFYKCLTCGNNWRS